MGQGWRECQFELWPGIGWIVQNRKFVGDVVIDKGVLTVQYGFCRLYALLWVCISSLIHIIDDIRCDQDDGLGVHARLSTI